MSRIRRIQALRPDSSGRQRVAVHTKKDAGRLGNRILGPNFFTSPGTEERRHEHS
jgi:hypothetical protein